jgi:uncharacterized RDD family membrane protein YckC
MDRKNNRTIIAIDEHQPALDFDEAAHSLPFTFPEYQRSLITSRLEAGLTDFGVIAGIYVIFLATTFFQMPPGTFLDRRVLGIYAAGYLVLAAIYFFLFMISASQTPGMKVRNLTVVNKEGQALDPRSACFRGLGYLISILPLMLGFLWVAIDPEHLTWADKVSGTYVKKV